MNSRGLQQKEWLKYREEGVYYLIDVSEQWTMGRVPNPELQAVGIDFLEHSGIRRMGAVAAGGPASRGPQSFNQQGAGQQVAGQQPILEGKQFRVVHDHGFNNLVTYCVGTLTITAIRLSYQASAGKRRAPRSVPCQEDGHQRSSEEQVADESEWTNVSGVSYPSPKRAQFQFCSARWRTMRTWARDPLFLTELIRWLGRYRNASSLRRSD